jgi:hypothetical protein
MDGNPYDSDWYQRLMAYNALVNPNAPLGARPAVPPRQERPQQTPVPGSPPPAPSAPAGAAPSPYRPGFGPANTPYTYGAPPSAPGGGPAAPATTGANWTYGAPPSGLSDKQKSAVTNLAGGLNDAAAQIAKGFQNVPSWQPIPSSIPDPNYYANKYQVPVFQEKQII